MTDASHFLFAYLRRVEAPSFFLALALLASSIPATAQVVAREGDQVEPPLTGNPSSPTERSEFNGIVSVDAGRLVLFGGTVYDAAAGLQPPFFVPMRNAVHVFSAQTGSGWALEQTLVDPNTSPGYFSTRFGVTGAIAGEWLTVSAIDDEVGGVSGAGSIYLYQRVAGSWTNSARIVEPLPQQGAQFGWSHRLEGDLLVVGSYRADTTLGAGTGAVHVYRRTASSWNLEQTILPPIPLGSGRFGFTLAVEGKTIVASQVDSFGSSATVLHVYRNQGGTWSLEATLSSPFTGLFGEGSLSGRCDLSGDRLVGISQVGRAIQFERVGATWSAGSALDVVDRSSGFEPVSGVLMEGDTLALTAWEAETVFPLTGAVYLFGIQNGAWQQSMVVVPQSDGTPLRFGAGASFDGTALAVAGGNSPSLAHTFNVIEEEFDRSCMVDQISGATACTPCPCNSVPGPGTRGGCKNSRARWGILHARGVASAAADSLSFDVDGAMPSSFALLFSGTALLPIAGACPPGSGLNQTPIIDGLRCVGGGASVRRLGTRPTNEVGRTEVSWSGVIAQGGFAPGETRHFQVFYRDTGPVSCGSGQNSTNAVTATILP